MKVMESVSREQLIEEIMFGYDFASEMSAIATNIQDVLAQVLIDNERAVTKKTGPYRPHEMHILKCTLADKHPAMTAEQISFMRDSISFYLEGLEDNFYANQKNQSEETSLGDLKKLVFVQMVRQERFELMLGSMKPAKTPQ